MNKRFSEEWAIVGTIDPTGSTTGTTTTDVVDMDEVEEVVFILSAGAIAATGTVQLTINSGTATGTVTTAVEALTQLGATDDNKQQIFQCRPVNLTAGHRYVQGSLVQGTAASACSVVVLTKRRYNPASDHDLATVSQIHTEGVS